MKESIIWNVCKRLFTDYLKGAIQSIYWLWVMGLFLMFTFVLSSTIFMGNASLMVRFTGFVNVLIGIGFGALVFGLYLLMATLTFGTLLATWTSGVVGAWLYTHEFDADDWFAPDSIRNVAVLANTVILPLIIAVSSVIALGTVNWGFLVLMIAACFVSSINASANSQNAVDWFADHPVAKRKRKIKPQAQPHGGIAL